MSSAVRHHTVQVPATTANLGPGFDAFGLALDLHLYVGTVSRSHQTQRVRTTGPETDQLESGDDNLVWRSFVSFCERNDVAVPDVALRAHTEIPLERGLGSSSAAIAAGLVLARALTSTPVGDRELVSIASDIEGHPDNVAPALLGGLVACARDDEGALVVRRVNPTPALRPLLFVPSLRQSTKAARAVIPAVLPREAAAEQAARAGHVLAALAGTWPADVRVSGDLLHEPPRLEVMPDAGALVDGLRAAGHHAWLSGAGPSVVAVVESVSGPPEGLDGIARDAGCELVASRFQLAGALVCPDDGCALAGTQGCVQCPRRRV